jgi:small-conductance mechanosensitive channel
MPSNSLKEASMGQPDIARILTSIDQIRLPFGMHQASLLDVASFLVLGILIYYGAKLAYRLLTRVIAHSLWLDGSQRALLHKLAGIAVIALAVPLGADILGIDLKVLTVFSGAFGLAVGFGLQKTFGNLLAGLILLLDRSLKPGDVIVVGNTFGTISRIGVRAISVVTRDGKEFLIPNEKLMTETMENWSYSSKDVRLHIPVGVAYDSDIAQAQALMIEAASGVARVLTDPAPTVWLRGFGESSVDHEIMVWITDPEQGVGNVQSEILNKLWVLFKDNGVEIPFSQRDIHIRSLPADVIANPAPPLRAAPFTDKEAQ